MRVKVCGITNLADAGCAADAGAHALGFVFAPSPRRVTPELAAEIVDGLPPFVQTVGVVVDQDVEEILSRCRLDAVQFHGSEPPETLSAIRGVRRIKAFRVADGRDLEQMERYVAVADAFLLDARVEGIAGGTGQTFPWHLAREARCFGRPIILAGGLTPENVRSAIDVGCPDAVDVSSMVEVAPGKKDSLRVRQFVAAALSSGMQEMSATIDRPGYAFGHSDLAARRLQFLAEVFAPAMSAFVQGAGLQSVELAVDLGCGPGDTTYRLAELLACERVVGFDISERFVSIADQTAGGRVSFCRHDFTQHPSARIERLQRELESLVEEPGNGHGIEWGIRQMVLERV